MPAKVYSDRDGNLSVLKSKTLAVLGFGSQGHAHALNLKESGLKVQAQIQGDKVRVNGKKRDDLQAAIAFLRKSEAGVPLQFENFRD